MVNHLRQGITLRDIVGIEVIGVPNGRICFRDMPMATPSRPPAAASRRSLLRPPLELEGEAISRSTAGY